MKKTLLGIVQDVLNTLDTDEVNSITDTAEAVQVAQIVESTYYEMLARRDWPHLRKLGKLNSISDNTRKTMLGLPEDVTRLDVLTYNKVRDGETRARWQEIKYKEPEEFLRDANKLNSDNNNVITVSLFGGASVQVRNDRAPEFWTSFDDSTIVMDGIDSDVESTLQGDKTQAYFYVTPSWSMADGFIPDLPIEAFPALISEVKSVAALEVNQEANEKAEQQSRRQQRRMSNQSWVARGGIRRANYGRTPGKRVTYNSNPLLEK